MSTNAAGGSARSAVKGRTRRAILAAAYMTTSATNNENITNNGPTIPGFVRNEVIFPNRRPKMLNNHARGKTRTGPAETEAADSLHTNCSWTVGKWNDHAMQ